MTICIAAVCDHGRTIILAADTEVGLGYTSTEMADGKFLSLFTSYKQWSVGLSGTIQYATDVLHHFRKFEDDLKGLSVQDIRPALEKAYRNARLAIAEGLYLAPTGWTLDEFKDRGTKDMPITKYNSIDNRIVSLEYDASLLVAGFGKDDLGPSILTIRNPGISTDQSKLGFWSIGSGSTLAQSSLFYRKYSWGMPLDEALYLVYEAKKLSQDATGVNDVTHLFIIGKGCVPVQIEDKSLRQLKNIWELSP